MSRHSLAAALAVLATGMAVPEVGATFRHARLGDRLPGVTLPTVDGARAPLLRTDRAVNVFFFIRPDQENSHILLGEIARCEQELAGRSIHWVGVVSSYYPLADSLAAARTAGVRAPILVDQDDVLYGKLGVELHPSVGMADGKGVLRAYEPFRKLNYCVVIQARIRHLLGEIDDVELERTLHPARATQGGADARAHQNLKFGSMLLKAKKYDKAVDKTAHAIELEPGLAAAHALMGAILAAQGNCAEAAKSFGRALALDPANAEARADSATCGATPPTADELARLRAAPASAPASAPAAP